MIIRILKGTMGEGRNREPHELAFVGSGRRLEFHDLGMDFASLGGVDLGCKETNDLTSQISPERLGKILSYSLLAGDLY